MKSKLLKTQREGLVAELDTLAAKPELTDDEKNRWEELEGQVKGLDRDIRLEESKENHVRLKASSQGVTLSEKEERDISQYSFVKAIQDVLQHGRPQGLEGEMNEEAARELREIGHSVSSFAVPRAVLIGGKKRSDVTTSTAPLVPTNLVGFIDALYAKMFITQLGAEVMTGLVGNVSIPRLGTAASAGWKTEVADAADAGSDTDDIDLTPKRLTCYQDVSKLLIMQSPYAVEGLMRKFFIDAMSVAVDKAAIAGAADGPTGILATSGIGAVVGGTHGLAPTMDHLLQLIREVAVDDADIGNLAFLTNPKVRYKLQSTPVVAGLDDDTNYYGWAASAAKIWPVDVRDKLVGYDAHVTTQAPSTLTKGDSVSVCSAIVFGNWAENILAQFGAIDITVDPLSQAIGNKTRIVLNSFWDHALRHPASMAAMKDALTA